ncbi:MAG: hypothetical protein LBM78_02880 [Clostridiales bacterium]|jgi:vacuolar-type H+-ATPase subunit E/Vma4|nr:hypothetical protein [Clostridiales bacterium]
MDNLSVITDRIRADAEAAAAATIAEAQSDAEALFASARARADAAHESALADARVQAAEIVKNRLTLAALEEKRGALSARQGVVDKVFASVEGNLTADAGAYAALCASMIKKYAEAGDTVAVSAQDAAVLTEAWAARAGQSAGIAVGYRVSQDKYRGLKLTNAYCDKNLILSELLSTLRQDIEPEVAKILFGDKE